MKLPDLTKSGVSFLLVAHDNDCPGAHGDPSNCCCEPEVRFADEAEFVASANQNRAARRAAAHQAEKALGKAGGRHA